MAELDLVVIGAGPGGYVAAIRAAQLGLRTTVVEQDRAGGVCGNWGCIPSKAILADAEIYRELRHAGARGIVADGLRVDFARVLARSREAAARQAQGVESLFRKHRIELVQGWGRPVAGGVEVQRDGAKSERLAARHVLLATGSRERLPPGLRVDKDVVQTSREALEDPRLPASLIVIGGGAVGVEFAYAYASFGSRVTVVEMAETLLPGMDADLGRVLGHRFEHLELEGDRGCVTVAAGSGPRTLHAHRVLAAVGRAPLTDGLELDALGARTDHGFVVVDGAMRTSAKALSAIGDLVGPLLLAHAASEQGVLAVETIAGHRNGMPAFDPTRVPMCVYCQPEVAAIGLTEAEARARGPIKVGKVPFRAIGKAMATGHTEGMAKLIAGARHGEILGVHLIGHGVTELVGEAGLALTLEATTHELRDTVHAHPTLSEILREAALAAQGEAVNI
jgi:dihydrolipoamide dehydrogenase